jgi:hypothetical protein
LHCTAYRLTVMNCMEISYPMNFKRGNLPHTYPKTSAAETN